MCLCVHVQCQCANVHSASVQKAPQDTHSHLVCSTSAPCLLFTQHQSWPHVRLCAEVRVQKWALVRKHCAEVRRSRM
jgi:hypothetical protein